MEWYLKVVRDNYANFSGRARRKEYWMFVLFNIIISMVLGFIFPMLQVVYSLAVLIPGFAVAVRRMHDVGKSGWFFLVGFIPIIGSIWIIFLMCKDSDSSDNAYGACPK